MEKYENGELFLELSQDNNENYIVDLFIDNKDAEIPYWNHSIGALTKRFVKYDNAKAYFYKLKSLLEYQEPESIKIPEGYVPVEITSEYYGSHPEYGEDDEDRKSVV